MICLYDKMETAFDKNGIVLSPSVCTVSEETCGSYELYLEHPFEENGKHLMLAEDMIIRAPVPHTVIPSVTLPETIIYTVSAVGPFWKKMPVARHKKAEQDNLSFIRNNSTNYTWNRNKSWNKDGYAVYGGVIYKANKFVSGDQTPLQNPDAWTRMGTVSGSASDDSNYVPGEEFSPALEVGQRVRRLGAVSDTVIQVRDPLGRVGYYQLSNLTQTTIEAETLPEQVIDNQLFRIYAVESEEETHVIKVSARHISYDFSGNTLLDCKLEDTAVNDAIAVFQGNLMIPDNRRIACEFDDNKITKDWSYKNPVNALLDPDDGLVAELKAKLIRNNRDYFILKNTNPRKGPVIEYGVNLQGVTWTRNVETVITRVVPRCSDKADGYIYLESGGTWDDQGVWVPNNDIYVDSPIALSYPFPRIEVLDAGFSVGDKYTPAGSKNEIERTTQNCREEMLKQAKERFTVDHCDAPEITLDVEFTLLGDTEQYKQYRGLQRVNLYDELTIKTETYEATAQVTSYEFDCLTKRYNAITVGEVSSFNKRVPGYKVVNESITYAKLAPDLVSRIRTMDAASGASTGAGSSGTPGTGYENSTTVNVNSKDEAGIVTKGDGNANKVWGTDAQGNPGWTTPASGPAVYDGLDSSSTTDALSAKQGKVINDKLKIEEFQLTFASSITDLYIRGQKCYKDLSTGMIHISFAIGSDGGKIPFQGNTIATVPDAYKPNVTGGQFAGYGLFGTSNQTFLPEAIQITNVGEIKPYYWINTMTNIKYAFVSIRYKK